MQNEKLTQDDLTDLALLRLDLMSVIQVDKSNGLPGLVHSAHLLPAGQSRLRERVDSAATDLGHAESTAEVRTSLSAKSRAELSLKTQFDESAVRSPQPVSENGNEPYQFLEPHIPSQLDNDFLSLITSLEAELARIRRVGRKSDGKGDRAILVSVTIGDVDDARESLSELEELALSAGVVVLDKIIQRRSQIDPRTVLGKGKLEDLLVRSMRLGADVIVFDSELSPAQVRSLSEATDLKVIDRPQLILDIFAQRAQSREGKLQVELAQLKYLLPRLVLGPNSAFSRLAGGIGGRGPGETKLETDRRRVRDRIAQLEKQVDNLGRQRQERRKNRVAKNLPNISLVGYTNAGKSTLLNALTQSEVYVERQMFATLDPTSRRLRLPYGSNLSWTKSPPASANSRLPTKRLSRTPRCDRLSCSSFSSCSLVTLLATVNPSFYKGRYRGRCVPGVLR
ncbi:MAG: GTPase HflX [Acidobacteria bacterium]|nr:GTPase HflX [Acidobacteriota bacterium]